MASLKVPLAEGNLVNQQVAPLLLQSNGIETDLANNGLEAVEAVRNAEYDLILMDAQMPEMVGIQTTKAIIEDDDVTHKPVILALTANALKSDQEACEAAGMLGFISKLIIVAELKAALIDVLEQKAIRSQNQQ